MMSSIKKAIIPIAGKGTRFLPATKVVPKEVIPIINVPMIYYVVQEAVQAGLDQIIFVTSRGKTSVAEFFDRHMELESYLESKGDLYHLGMIKEIAAMTQIITVTQKEQLGLGHAILQASELINKGERFCVLLGDDIVVNAQHAAIGQLMDISDRHQGGSVIGVMEVAPADVHRYGIVGGEWVDGDPKTMRIDRMVEKPAPELAPSLLATPGRYVLNSGIFDVLKKIPKGRGGEYQLTDAINVMCAQEPFYAHLFDGDRYDTGHPMGYFEAVVNFALKNPLYREEAEGILRKVMNNL